MHRFQNSLANRIVAYILAAIACFGLVIGGGSFLFVKHLLTQQISNQLNFDLQKASLDIEKPLNNLVTDLQQLANNPLLASGLTDSLGRGTYLQPFFLQHPLAKLKYGELLLTDFSSHGVLTTSASLKNLIENSLLAKQVIESNQPRAEIVDDLQLVIIYPVIFPPTGYAEGLVVYRINLKALLDDISAELTDDQLTLNYKNKTPETTTPKSALITTSTPLRLHSPLDVLDFNLTVGKSRQIAMNALNQTTQIYILAAFIMLILAAWLSRKLSQKLLKNLNILITKMDSVDNTKEILRESNLFEKGDQEIQQLASAFNHLLLRLNKSYLELEDKVTERTKDLITAKAQAEASAMFKSNFLTNMSHEIRTPMNAIVGLSNLALNKEVTPEIRDYLEKIYSSSEGLLLILNDILDFAKLEAGRMAIEHSNFDLESVLENLQNLFSVRAEEKGLQFDISIASFVPLHLVGDSIRIQQILTNLLGNAIKFTERGFVKLKVDLVQTVESQTQLLFSIEDSGIGISENNIQKLFAPFSQADGSITRRFGGTGLGLAISHNLLELMGGDIKIRSELGKGTCFNFELVLGVSSDSYSLSHEVKKQKVEHHAGSLSSYFNKRSHNLAGISLLVVEDNTINQQVIKEFLELSQISIVIANNGKEALTVLNDQTFDAILMDIHMPEMDGFEATQRIRALEQFKNLPIIALTAGVTQEEHQHCLNCGMNDFVAKPIIPDQLIDALSRWIKNEAKMVVDLMPPLIESMSSELENLDGFELKNLLLMLGGNKEKAVKLLLDFKTNMATIPADINLYVKKNDWLQARELAHKIKGIAANLGAIKLHKITTQLEEEFKTDGVNQEILDQFNAEFDKTIAVISTLKGTPQTLQNNIIDLEALQKIALKIDNALADDDYVSQDMLDELKANLSPDKTNEFVALCRAIETINYQQARYLLKQLVNVVQIANKISNISVKFETP